MTKEFFFKKINENFINVPSDFFEQIEKYKDFLLAENEKYNLTNLHSEEKIYSDYFFNSIIPYKNFDFNSINNILDVGSGSGIPGFLIKLMYPNINLSIVESNSKKCNFMQELINILNLNNVFIINERIEIYSLENKDKFDLVTSRAVANLKILIEVCFPLVKNNGIFHTVKSNNVFNEIDSSSKIITIYNIAKDDIKVDKVYTENISTYSVAIIKHSKTPNNFPRPWRDIVK